MSSIGKAQLEEVTLKLLGYCRRNDWAGYDPYDALNSRVFRATPFSHSKFCRIAFTQFMKRSPINFRPILGVPKKRNPKGTALFVSALIKLKRAGMFTDDTTIRALADDLTASRSNDQPYSCWGYSFDWQTRGYLVPEGSPNIICTTFAGNALLDAWEEYRDDNYLQYATSAACFLRETLVDELDNGEACFNYTPITSSRIHNANLLGAAYVARVASATNDHAAFDLVCRATRYSVRKQATNGSWPYGEAPTQRWIDNFHTGYNICALQTIKETTNTPEFDESIRKGLAFYMEHFFLHNGAPKYFHNRAYPIDIHSAAQSFVTLARLSGVTDAASSANAVVSWTLEHMRNGKGGFHYQKHACFTNRISYMRWSQAWMLLALSVLCQLVAEGSPYHPTSQGAE